MKAFPSLRHLVSWMEVSTSATRFKYLSQNSPERKERIQRVRVCQVDLKKKATPISTHFTDAKAVSEALTSEGERSSKPDVRIYVVEDLSRDVVELFGQKFGIDPHFWKSHIDDYLWWTARQETVEIRSLDLLTRARPYLTLQYLRPRYYASTTSFEKATKQAAIFNVLRQLDGDRG